MACKSAVGYSHQWVAGTRRTSDLPAVIEFSSSHIRAIRTTFRTAHIAAFSILYGGLVFGIASERLAPAWSATLATGIAFMALEISQFRYWPIQLRGATALIKVGLVCIAWVLRDWQVFISTLVLVIGSVSSHMPARFRYYSLVHRRSIGHDGKG